MTDERRRILPSWGETIGGRSCGTSGNGYRNRVYFDRLGISGAFFFCGIFFLFYLLLYLLPFCYPLRFLIRLFRRSVYFHDWYTIRGGHISLSHSFSRFSLITFVLVWRFCFSRVIDISFESPGNGYHHISSILFRVHSWSHLAMPLLDGQMIGK